MIITLCQLVRNDENISPSIRKDERHSSTSFTCNSTTEVSWYSTKSGLLPIRKAFYKGNPFKIKVVSLDNAGIYFCYSKTANSEIPFMAKAELQVFGKFIKH